MGHRVLYQKINTEKMNVRKMNSQLSAKMKDRSRSQIQRRYTTQLELLGLGIA